MIVYFVSYSYIGGFGQAEITSEYEIQDFDDIKRIKSIIEKENNIEGVIILNYIKLKGLAESSNLKRKVVRKK